MGVEIGDEEFASVIGVEVEVIGVGAWSGGGTELELNGNIS